MNKVSKKSHKWEIGDIFIWRYRGAFTIEQVVRVSSLYVIGACIYDSTNLIADFTELIAYKDSIELLYPISDIVNEAYELQKKAVIAGYRAKKMKGASEF